MHRPCRNQPSALAFRPFVTFSRQDIFARHDPVGLVRIAAVCRRWRKLCRDQPALFRRVVLGRSSHQDRVTRDVLEWFVGNGTAIRQLDLENCEHGAPLILPFVRLPIYPPNPGLPLSRFPTRRFNDI